MCVHICVCVCITFLCTTFMHITLYHYLKITKQFQIKILEAYQQSLNTEFDENV